MLYYHSPSRPSLRTGDDRQRRLMRHSWLNAALSLEFVQQYCRVRESAYDEEILDVAMLIQHRRCVRCSLVDDGEKHRVYELVRHYDTEFVTLACADRRAHRLVVLAAQYR